MSKIIEIYVGCQGDENSIYDAIDKCIEETAKDFQMWAGRGHTRFHTGSGKVKSFTGSGGSSPNIQVDEEY
ncbi:hypothetical protein COT12_01530 [Candidatus Berkelbacteria bacterium CG08_land_8_20_14_0_20_39_8]|uniref:Uncharacterized protein n=1 Tax=Candidatus Berkelbacteria bacterium CG08_land_8_20_14_0_20_39_8 TaxID=1974511 RepID=A0A2M6YCC7_9BACT|nr:MAG: hypothetical protein COT12_01530 [Candidatus Berkelbacteria bacterium CG08_land_8_20_14_0_20_39_8]